MLFNSVTFLAFVCLVVVVYGLITQRLRASVLLLTSISFYGFWKIEFIPLLLFSAMVDYFVSLNFKGSSPIKKRILLMSSLVCNVGLLLYFKYLYFFADSFSSLLSMAGFPPVEVPWQIILPLGISFYTFQTISYTVDCYRGVILPERNLVHYLTYVSFFPQLIAGPILRASEVIPQIQAALPASKEQVLDGIDRIIKGLFLKVVIADNVAPFVESGFSMPSSMLMPLDVWTLAFLFGFQIYFDFSAYSHIAIGTAKLLGFDFPENFNFPYMAKSPKDFWRRWHISLSSWIRDYLYLPLSKQEFKTTSTGGLETAFDRRKKNVALYCTWAIMGLWHGASWTFLLWGGYHATIVFITRMVPVRFPAFMSKKLQDLVGFSFTLPVIMLSWIPFRADSINDTFIMWGKLFELNKYTLLGMRENVYLIAALLLCGTTITAIVSANKAKLLNEHRPLEFIFNLIFYFFCICLIIIFLRPVEQFIYFQF